MKHELQQTQPKKSRSRHLPSTPVSSDEVPRQLDTKSDGSHSETDADTDESSTDLADESEIKRPRITKTENHEDPLFLPSDHSDSDTQADTDVNVLDRNVPLRQSSPATSTSHWEGFTEDIGDDLADFEVHPVDAV